MVSAVHDNYDIVFDDFVKEYPRFEPLITRWYASARNEIIVVLTDGSKQRFNWIDRSLFQVVESDGFIDEEQWRKEFSHRLYIKMCQQGYSQDEFAEDTGISLVTINKYLKGKATPSGYNMDKMAYVLNCDSSELGAHKIR